MEDCTYFLYDSCKRKFPYIPTEPSILRAQERLETALAHTQTFPKEYRADVFELRDALDVLSYEQAHHAFILGLDLGLSAARELEG